MVKNLAEELELTIHKLDSVSRRLVLLRECVVKNKEFLNEYDLIVYRGIIDSLSKELDELRVNNNVITELLESCSGILDDMEEELKSFNSCYITASTNENLTEDITERLDFQLRSLIAVRGVKQFYLNSKTSLGKLATEVLNSISDTVNIRHYNNEDVKFKIELNQFNVLEFEEVTI